MAKAPNAGAARPHTPSAADKRDALEGEIVEATERALARGDSNDLDASLAVALSEAEINQQIATARRFPRPKQKAIDDIVELATADLATATECIYSLPRGRDPETGKPKAIVGASIRFAELVMQCWGNNRVAARVVAIDRKDKFVAAEGIYHDLETNSAIKSEVRRRISDKRGALFSEDMIIVTGNAAASIALRNAILRGVPKAVWARAYEKVEKVVAGDEKTIGARRVALLTRFRDELGIKPDVLYAILGVTGEMDVGREELVVAGGFFTALRQNEVTVEDLLREAGVNEPGGVGHRTLDQGHARRPPGSSETGARREDEQREPERSPAAPDASTEVIDQETGEVTEPRPTETGSAPSAAAPPASSDSVMPASTASPAETSSRPEPAQPSDDFPGDKPKAADLTQTAKPREYPEDEIQPDGDVAGPGERYFLSSDTWDASGLRPAYMDGVRVSSAGRRLYEDGEIFIFTDHSPEVNADPDGSTPGREEEKEPAGETLKSPPSSDASPVAETTAEPEEQTRAASPESRGLALAIEEYRAKVKAAESYLTIKSALGALRKVAAFVELPDELQRPERVFAYVHADALARVGKDPVSIVNDPSFYLLWLDTEPAAGEIQDARQRLIRTEAYRALKDVYKDQIAAATDKALGGDI